MVISSKFKMVLLSAKFWQVWTTFTSTTTWSPCINSKLSLWLDNWTSLRALKDILATLIKVDIELLVCNLSQGKLFNSSKLYLNLLKSSTTTPPISDPIWTIINQTQTLPKIKIFFWMLAWNSLSTGDSLSYRFIISNALCKIFTYPS